jgi:hypothetical protein
VAWWFREDRRPRLTAQRTLQWRQGRH